MEADLYQLFRVAPEAPFSVIKRAYYARAKECHPDRFGNSPVKTAEFQELVAAFNILSDPLLRRRYDRERLGVAGIDWGSPDGPVLDTEADDILEELIVGNNAPPETSLATLLSDLAKTEVFITFREGKDCYFRRDFRNAAVCFRRVLMKSPQNILYQVFMARNAAQLGDPRTARRHYRQALALGLRRKPPLRMPQVRREYDRLLEKHFPLYARLRKMLVPAPLPEGPDDAEQEIAALNRSLTRAYRREIAAPEALKKRE